MQQDMILVIDLGSEENATLAREIRALGVYSEIHAHDLTESELKALPNVRGIILNGGGEKVLYGIYSPFALKVLFIYSARYCGFMHTNLSSHIGKLQRTKHTAF